MVLNVLARKHKFLRNDLDQVNPGAPFSSMSWRSGVKGSVAWQKNLFTLVEDGFGGFGDLFAPMIIKECTSSL